MLVRVWKKESSLKRVRIWQLLRKITKRLVLTLLKEKKKKPKDKSVQPKLTPLSEAPQQAELIKKQRKPRWDEESGEG